MLSTTCTHSQSHANMRARIHIFLWARLSLPAPVCVCVCVCLLACLLACFLGCIVHGPMHGYIHVCTHDMHGYVYCIVQNKCAGYGGRKCIRTPFRFQQNFCRGFLSSRALKPWKFHEDAWSIGLSYSQRKSKVGGHVYLSLCIHSAQYGMHTNQHTPVHILVCFHFKIAIATDSTNAAFVETWFLCIYLRFHSTSQAVFRNLRLTQIIPCCSIQRIK